MIKSLPKYCLGAYKNLVSTLKRRGWFFEFFSKCPRDIDASQYQPMYFGDYNKYSDELLGLSTILNFASISSITREKINKILDAYLEDHFHCYHEPLTTKGIATIAMLVFDILWLIGSCMLIKYFNTVYYCLEEYTMVLTYALAFLLYVLLIPDIEDLMTKDKRIWRHLER